MGDFAAFETHAAAPGSTNEPARSQEYVYEIAPSLEINWRLRFFCL